jgi:diphthine-ammonia ligase
MNAYQEARCALSFSGGKDSMLALDRALKAGARVEYLLTLYDEASQLVRFHNVPLALIQAQADSLGIPLLAYPYAPEHFEAVFLQALHELKQHNIDTILFGNIHLADVRAWYEERTTAAGFIHREPLWGEAPAQLVRAYLARGYKALLTCIELTRARPEWLGAQLDEALVREFEQEGIDPCGERGEYHTFVYDGPLFAQPLPVHSGSASEAAGFRMIDVRL